MPIPNFNPSQKAMKRSLKAKILRRCEDSKAGNNMLKMKRAWVLHSFTMQYNRKTREKLDELAKCTHVKRFVFGRVRITMSHVVWMNFKNDASTASHLGTSWGSKIHRKVEFWSTFCSWDYPVRRMPPRLSFAGPGFAWICILHPSKCEWVQTSWI